MKNNNGAALLELVISIGFISIIIINAFIITNNILNKNAILYSDQIERKTINTVYTKIAQDFYKYNIKSFSSDNPDNNMYTFNFYTTSSNEIEKRISIDTKGLTYNDDKIPNNSSFTFNSIDIKIDKDNNILTMTIKYNDDKTLNIYSINYKGEN